MIATMYNIVRTRELTATGLSNAVIKRALSCCLQRLSYGIYTVIRRCTDPRHARISNFATDDDWLRTCAEHEAGGAAHDHHHDALIYKLMASSYPHYRADDVLVGMSAAIFHDLPLYKPPLTRIFVANPSTHSSTPLVRRSLARIDETDTITTGKMCLSTPARAALEMVSQLGDAQALPAIDDVVRIEVFGSRDAANTVARRGYPPDTDERARVVIDAHLRPLANRLQMGRRRALGLLDLASAKSESYAESRGRLNLELLKIMGFEPQVDLFDSNGRWIARVDFYHAETRTVLFIDGTTKYVIGGFRQMRTESAQHNALVASGHRVIRMGFAESIDLEQFATTLFNQAPDLRRFIRR